MGHRPMSARPQHHFLEESAAPPATAASALELLAGVFDARTLPDAAHRLARALAGQLGLRWAMVATVDDGAPRVVATSSRDDLQAPQARDAIEPIEAAMAEAIDQGVSLAFPETARCQPAGAVLLAHRLLHARTGGSFATLPLAAHGKRFAVVMLHGDDRAFVTAQLGAVEDLLVLAAPALSLMQQAEEPWHRRLFVAVIERRRAWLGTGRRVWVAGAIAAPLLAFVAWPVTQHAAGRARVEGAQHRVLVAPADGYVRQVHARPGDAVTAGTVLLDLTEAELVLDRDQWSGQIDQQENAYASAMSRADRATAMVSLARLEEARVQLARIDGQLARAQLVAPFDGTVIQGDLAASVGAPVRQGDALMTLAAGDGHRVLVEVDEADIARVQVGQAGTLSLSSMPWDTLQLRVRRIAPLARVVEGDNVFDVEAELTGAGADPRLRAALRAGLQGRARIDVAERPLAVQWGVAAASRLRRLAWRWL